MTSTTMPAPTARRYGPLNAGWRQARVELRTRLLSINLVAQILGPAIAIAFMYFLGGSTTAAGVTQGQSSITSLATAALILGGFTGVAAELISEQDDGTLLRARTLPHGFRIYLVGKIISLTATSLMSMALLLVPAHFLLGPMLPADPIRLVALLAIVAVSLASTVPMGAVVGASLRSPLGLMPISLVGYALLVISGIFFPISVMPVWLQWVAKAFPMYWLGDLTRVTLLADLPAPSVTGVLISLIVPALWCVGGLLLAPKALRGMSQRQAGSRLEAVQARRAPKGY